MLGGTSPEGAKPSEGAHKVVTSWHLVDRFAASTDHQAALPSLKGQGHPPHKLAGRPAREIGGQAMSQRVCPTGLRPVGS